MAKAKTLPPLTPEEYPILYAAEQRHKKAERERQTLCKRELLAWIDSINPALYEPLLKIVRELPIADAAPAERGRE